LFMIRQCARDHFVRGHVLGKPAALRGSYAPRLRCSPLEVAWTSRREGRSGTAWATRMKRRARTHQALRASTGTRGRLAQSTGAPRDRNKLSRSRRPVAPVGTKNPERSYKRIMPSGWPAQGLVLRGSCDCELRSIDFDPDQIRRAVKLIISG
jgi:hypothetical protein